MKIPFKICGLTREEDVELALRFGASYLGFIMVPGTPRCITVERARRLFAFSPLKNVLVVGSLPLTEVQRLIDVLHPAVVQLHRNEPPEFALSLKGARIWRAFSLETMEDVEAAASYPAEAILADTGKGGSGRVGNWNLARELSKLKPVILAGGITSQNAREAFMRSRAKALDCSSGVEYAPGFKDKDKLKEFATVCNQ